MCEKRKIRHDVLILHWPVFESKTFRNLYVSFQHRVARKMKTSSHCTWKGEKPRSGLTGKLGIRARDLKEQGDTTAWEE